MVTMCKCLLPKADFGMTLMQKVTASHLNDFKRFCRSCLCMNFYKICVLIMLCFCVGQVNIYLYPLDQWGLLKSLENGQGIASPK